MSVEQPASNTEGSPVRRTMLPYARQRIEEADIEAVREVLRSDWLTTGPWVEAFEDAVASFVGARYAVAFSSGTAALHGAVCAAGLGPGDVAITTPLTFCATANCALYQGARVAFADIDPRTLTIDPEEIARCLSPRTKAILPMDYAGHPADVDAIRALADKQGLIVIEDACHALGAEYRGKRVGSLSHMSVFSFHPVKHITTGEGGMVTTNERTFAERLRLFREHGVTRDPARTATEPWYYEMRMLGWNYRLSDIACALGCSQLKRLPENLSRRRQIAARYEERLGTIRGLTLPTAAPTVVHAWHLYPVRINPVLLGMDRGAVFRALRAENIRVQVHYIPVHLHPYYRTTFGYRPGDFPHAEQAYDQLISLPMFHGMTDEDVEDVVRAFKKAIAKPALVGQRT